AGRKTPVAESGLTYSSSSRELTVAGRSLLFRSLLGLVCASAALLSTSAWATGVPSWWSPDLPPNIVEDRFRLEVNVFYPSFDTQIRADPSLTTPGTRISAEDDLGLEKTKVLADVELTLLPGEHHLLRLSGFEVRRAADTVLTKRIVFDDQTYNVNERVSSN